MTEKRKRKRRRRRPPPVPPVPCPVCGTGRMTICRGMCAACYQRQMRFRRSQASAPRKSDQTVREQAHAREQVHAREQAVSRGRVYPPRTVDVPGVCVGCQQTRIIKARGLCSGCRKRRPECALPVHKPAGRLEDVSTWTDEWCAHLDALAERVLRGEPVVGACKTRRDREG